MNKPRQHTIIRSLLFRHGLLLQIALFVVVNISGQSGKFFTVDNKLSSSLVQDVYQDHHGFIWIATVDGLNRYDASKFVLYKNNNSEKGSALSNFSHVVFEDSRQNLLIGYGNGLQRYDLATNSFTNVQLIQENGDTIHGYVTSIMERRNGDILISTSGYGIFQLVEQSESLQAFQVNNLIPSNFITLLYEDNSSNLWAASQDSGLFCRTREKELVNYFNEAALADTDISSFCETPSGDLFAGSPKKGLFKYMKDERRFVSVSLDTETSLAVNTLVVRRNGEMLIGTEGMGLRVFDPGSGHLSDGNFSVASVDLSRSKVTSILEDRSGNIWLGISQKGVVLIPATSQSFKYIGHKSIQRNIIGSSSITSLHKDQSGLLWIGTDGDGIYKLDKNGAFLSHFEPSPSNPCVPATVMAICEDSDKNIWLGSYEKGLVKMDRASGHCALMNESLDPERGKTTPVFSIAEDKQKNLWVGTLGSGLYKIGLANGQTTHYHPESDTANLLSDRLNNRWINTLMVSSDDKLYIGTVVGLGCFDLNTQSFISAFGTNRILPDLAITTIFEDREGIIWIGSVRGLQRLDPGTNEITAFSTADGLPGNVICAIAEDPAGDLWISTNYGLARMGKDSGEFTNYYSFDGLQGNEFNSGSVFADSGGQIYFGGINGITYFDPREINVEVKKPDIFLTGFFIHDREVNKGSKSGPYDIVNSPVITAETFHLSHRDNSFSIEFSAMEFANPERIIYMYKSASDKDWISLRPGTNNITFSNLSPTTHRLKVRARYFISYSNEREIAIIIHPPWYFSVWAKVAYVLILLMIMLFIFQQLRQRYRTKLRIQNHIQAKQVDEAKLQSFINIAHEIRTPMTLIINPLKKLMLADQDRDRQKSYARIHKNSERILHLINQLMDIQKIDKKQMSMNLRKIEMVGFIGEVCAVFEEQARTKQIELEFLHREEKVEVCADPENFDKALLNLLSNALKFTHENGRIKIELSTEADLKTPGGPDPCYRIVISDNGIGIPASEREKVFGRFYQAPEGKEQVKGGTGIGLHLTRSIIELHRGQIWIEDNPDGRGARFVLKLPVGQQELPVGQQELPGEKPNREQLSPHTEPTAPFPELTPERTRIVSHKPAKAYKILLVDDDHELLAFTSGELSKDYKVSTCANGKEALTSMLKEQPDLVVSDVVMPEMDGVTLCKKIKHHANVNHIPVILLTAKSGEEDKLKGLGTGADAYITKPFDIEILKTTIRNLIQNRILLRNNYSGNQLRQDKVRKVELSPPDEVLLSKVMDIIGTNLDNPDLNVEMLSREIGLSRVHLHRKLKELTNQSTSDYIRNIRLQQAATLLSKDKSMSVSEVAYAVGFTSAGHFSNAFKRFYGIPPSAYYELQVGEQP